MLVKSLSSLGLQSILVLSALRLPLIERSVYIGHRVSLVTAMNPRLKLADALKITHTAPKDAAPFRVALVCGFTPVHLQTFLNAHLQLLLPNRSVVITTGLYGDVIGTLEKLEGESADAVALNLEWEDLDPRLGFRSAGQWGTNVTQDILTTAKASLDRIAGTLLKLQSVSRVAVSGPSLSTAPLFHAPGWRATSEELSLLRDVADFRARLASDPRFGIVSPSRLDEDSPAEQRYDLKSDLLTGLPYSLKHVEVMGRMLATNIAPAAPKKGIITDLDDTLWSGIVGEIGPDAVTWDLNHHTHLHALYQKLLASLSSEGVLIAVASKNDPTVVERAMQRSDLLLTPDLVFPIEVHWSAKSGSVTRILQTWNIAADSVVFVDDSPMELAEVAAAHPGIETVLYPRDNVAQGLAMLRHLRDLCGKDRLSQDDKIRSASLRQGAAFREQAAASESAPESFLQQLNSVLTFDLHCVDSPRVFELVNKTNQFNLNGVRYTEAEWRRLVTTRNAVLMSVAYEDKFGPLGTIAVLQANLEASRAVVNAWVMSCRAFARRIEYAMLHKLFGLNGVDEVEFCFLATPRNGPLQDCLAAILGSKPKGQVIVNRTQFEQNCPPLRHEVRELKGAETNV